jgi:rhodanese-related sulfurtransferase
VDIREDWEREAYNIGGVHIPLGDLMARVNELPKDKEVVLYCEKGIRSVLAIQRLESMGFHNLVNLSGGMKAWKVLQ